MPGNIISLCGETNFCRKQNNKNLPNKLKFLFDIKDDKDCYDKINFYL